MNINTLTTPLAIVIGAALIALAISSSAPTRYELFPIANSTNPAAWKLNKATGDVSLCATASGQNTEAGCSVKLKQF